MEFQEKFKMSWPLYHSSPYLNIKVTKWLLKMLTHQSGRKIASSGFLHAHFSPQCNGVKLFWMEHYYFYAKVLSSQLSSYCQIDSGLFHRWSKQFNFCLVAPNLVSWIDDPVHLFLAKFVSQLLSKLRHKNDRYKHTGSFIQDSRLGATKEKLNSFDQRCESRRQLDLLLPLLEVLLRCHVVF